MFSCSICGQTFNKKHYFEAHMKSHDEQKEYIEQYMKESLDGIQYVNGVPKVVFVCWFGGFGTEIPPMSIARYGCFKDLVNVIGIPVILITAKNYKKFVLDDYPIHPAFEYLTGVHKANYFRCYLMNHYGGGYHDIKSRLTSWMGEFEKDDWTKAENIWMYGRQEKNTECIAYPPGMQLLQQEFKKLATMNWIICKKKTLFTIELMSKIHSVLDDHYDNLVLFPGINSGGYYSDKPFSLVPDNSYPIRWLEILGEIYHPLMLKYTTHIKFGLPDANKSKKYK